MKKNSIKDIWKKSNKNDMETINYSLQDIKRYREQKSLFTSRSGRLTIIFDIAFKALIFMMLVYLMISLEYQYPYQIIITTMLGITGLLTLLNIRFLNALQSIKESESVVDNLKNKLKYFTTTHKHFILVSALSTPLFVLSGFFIYYQLKYGEIRMESVEDVVVMALFVMAAFAISYFAQLPVHKIQVKELKESITDLDDTKMAESIINESKRARRNILIAFSIILLTGILVLLIVLMQ